MSTTITGTADIANTVRSDQSNAPEPPTSSIFNSEDRPRRLLPHRVPLEQGIRSPWVAIGALRSHINCHRTKARQVLPSWLIRDVRIESTPPPQSETTPFYPYAVSKCAALGKLSRSLWYLHVKRDFVQPRKITRAVGRIKIGLQSKLFLGNLRASREESHTVEEFLNVAFGYVGLNCKDHAAIDKKYFWIISRRGGFWAGNRSRVGFEELVRMVSSWLRERRCLFVDAAYMDAQQQP